MSTRTQLMRSVCLAAFASLAALGSAFANPTGGVVTSGGATITAPDGKTVNITQSTGQAAINWQSFSIGKGETVAFIQPTATSVALNRVVGADPSSIFGSLQANGIVMLVNPNGVVFGRGSKVDVGGLVATTADIKDKDFAAGKYNFAIASAARDAGVANAGDITIRDGGLVALVAPSVRNSGVITARLGRVALGAGRTFTVDFQGDGLLSFDASSVVKEVPLTANGKPVKALLVNTGRISADGGSVALSARAVKGVVDHAINTSGVIAANSVGSVNGKIVLSGGGDGAVEIAGKIDATGKAGDDTGGSVVATGGSVDVVHGARVDASGSAGGGTIAIGSDGSGTWSKSVSVAKGATLVADAVVKGNGGQITVLGDKRTAFAGNVSAHGGAHGGDGGTAEVSSHNDINLSGKVSLTAATGRTGKFLIDPATLEITDDNATVNSDNIVSRGWLESQSADASIDLQASGQITVDAMAGHLINLATTSGNSFSLTSTESGGITFIDPQTEIRTQGGSIYLSALGVGSTITNLGKLTSNGGDIGVNADGDITLANVLDAGAGSVWLQSNSGSVAALNGAVRVAGDYLNIFAGGSIGSAAAPLATSTTQFALQSGGDIVVANDQVLTDLEIVNSHAAPGVANTISIVSPSLAFSMGDDGAQYTLAQVSGAALQTFSFSGDQGISVGAVATDPVNGTVSVTADAGDIVGSGAGITSGTVFLTAGLGSVGSAAAPVVTNTPQLIVQTAGNLYAANGQPLTDLDITSSHADPNAVFAFQVTAPGLTFDVADTAAGYVLGKITADNGTTFNFSGDRGMTIGAIDVGRAGYVSLSNFASSGSIAGDGSAPVAIQAGTVALYTPDSIGTAGTPLTIIAGDVSAMTSNGGVYLAVPAVSGTATTLDGIYAGGPIVVMAAAGDLVSNRAYAASGDVTITANAGSVSNAGYIYAGGADGAQGAITLASAGSVVTATGSLGSDIQYFNPGGGPISVVGSVGTVVLARDGGGTIVTSAHPAGTQLTAAKLGQSNEGAAAVVAPAAEYAPSLLRLRGGETCGGATAVTAAPKGAILLTGAVPKDCQAAFLTISANPLLMAAR